MSIDQRPTQTKACVIHVHKRRSSASSSEGSVRSPKARLDEAIGLALAINLDIVHAQLIQIQRPAPSTLIGKGNVEALGAIIRGMDVELVVIDHALSPIQQRNLERAWKCKVIDRTGLIIEIFGDRARTAEGSLQVELAALSYQRSRLVKSWTHLERQRGGFGFLGGPGESQLELDRRMIDERMIKIRKELENTKRTRGLHREARKRVPFPVIALVGYTNAGKSTLFNRLTGASVFAEDLLFATLDPTMRHVKLPQGQEIILSDTVGFISDLPTQLVVAFRATLEEVLSADLILHVRDISHPDSEAQAEDVYRVLEELDIHHPLESGLVVEVLNKMDQLSPEDQEITENRLTLIPTGIGISALTGMGCETLLALINDRLKARKRVYHVTIRAEQGDLLAWCYRQGAIVTREDEGEVIHLTLRLEPDELTRLQSMGAKVWL